MRPGDEEGGIGSSMVQIQLAVTWGYLDAAQAGAAIALADRMVAITWRLTRPRR